MKLLNIKDQPCVQYRWDKKAHLSCKCKFHGNSLQQQRIFYYSGSFGNYRSLGKNKTKIISIKCNNLWCILVFLAHDTLLILCRQVEKRILDTLMDPKVYDARIRPSGANDTDSATVVIVNIFVRSFSKIDDVKMVSSCHSHINLSNRNMISIFIKWWFFRKNLMYILYI